MGKIINSTFVSSTGSSTIWTPGISSTPTMRRTRSPPSKLLASDALLMGRNTYEVYAASWPTRDGVYPEKINSMQKYVVSTTLDKADWTNTTVIKGDLVGEVSTLKQQRGDILMHGFGPVAQTLIRNGLLDMLHLWVYPHFAGVGTTSDMLFSEGNNTRLKLIGTRTLGSGIVMLSYQVPGADRPTA